MSEPRESEAYANAIKRNQTFIATAEEHIQQNHDADSNLRRAVSEYLGSILDEHPHLTADLTQDDINTLFVRMLSSKSIDKITDVRPSFSQNSGNPVPGTPLQYLKQCRRERILAKIKEKSQAELIKELFGGNDKERRKSPQHATPDDYEYVSHTTHKKIRVGTVLALSPHPSDASSDFFPILALHTKALGGHFIEEIITLGEKGGEGSPQEVIQKRKEEEKAATDIIGIKPHYLTMENARHLPDGELLQHLPELVEMVKKTIREHEPRRLLLPSFYPDHPDHVATAIAGIIALTDLREEGFFRQHGEIEIIASDPEFAVAKGQPWAAKDISKAKAQALAAVDDYHRGRKGNTPPDLRNFLSDVLGHTYAYRYQDNHGGMMSPASNLISGEKTIAIEHDMAVPPYIITVPEEMEAKKLDALLEHSTQTGQKAYAHLIPSVDRVRALQLEKHGGKTDWAMGLYPLHIPGVSTTEDSLLNALPPGSVFQLKYSGQGR